MPWGRLWLALRGHLWQDADLILFMMDAEDGWREDDETVFETYVKPYAGEKPVILVINKVDK
jgi:GTP-binding protein Era